MEKTNFNYSLKNIPIPHTDSYMKCFISKVESLIRRMRWKALFFDMDKENKPPGIFTYRFNTEKAPPVNCSLTPFENDIYSWLNTIEFSKYRSDFQKKLTQDRRNIQSSTDVYVPADKSTNIYKMNADNYKKLLHSNVTANYKKTGTDSKLKIDRAAKKIAVDLKLDDRIECIAEREAFITLKDHKDNFENNPKCRLINPSKSEIGIISKHHLQEINDALRKRTQYLQWTNTQSVISWFQKIEHNNNQRFMQLDIVEFYPSISKQLLSNAITYAQTIIDIDPKIVDIIMHCRQSLLFAENSPWIKKSGDIFDVTMGSYDGAEVSELVGIYLLHLVNTAFPQISFGLYRDDGLGNYSNMPGPQTERTKKAITKIFRDNGFSITINMNMKQANFLDVSMDIETGRHKPYRKPNDSPLYINYKSNHPPTIIKEIPAMVQTRLSDLSCNVEEFDKVKDEYAEALSRSGFNQNLKYQKPTGRETNKQKRRRKRKRNTLWFNPPFNETVKNNIGKEFYLLIDKHFPKHHKYNPIFNRHNIRLSYSCTANMNSIISSHNKKVLNTPTEEELPRLCSCRANTICPLDGKCLTPAIVYQAHLTTEDRTEHYTGSTEPPWKERFSNHKSSFTHIHKRNDSGLSQRLWELREAGAPEPTITWSIHSKSYPYRCGSRVCDLCLLEKLAILKADPELVSLNVKSELMNKCRHSLKFKLKKV